MRFTKTFIATGSNTFSVATKEEYFDNADCTGAVVATGSYGVPDENVQYAPALTASVTLLTGENITADVNPATSVYAVATFSITGSGVKSTELIGTTLYARIEYTGGYVTPPHPALNGQTTQGALLLRNDELLALVPIVGFTNSFKVLHRYAR
ncbi:vacuolating cyotoxin family protein [Rhodoferax ferrireducens]|uniref:vacuolating cyotoxin family protein n=1 Tax=Rhodoferax ferrireducens TaxID=192843 RepID=UPI00298E7800|nr:vacuolating cyotoxin family protein [Rhodoferax ferrireducens]WPC66260.1 vacuolating cyotoxin family protein [Rhodoferax ferrireducens]